MLNKQRFTYTIFIIGTACALQFFSMSAHAETAAESTLKNIMWDEATRIVKTFGGRLKPHLKKALQSGGPANAIQICSIKAPKIAEDIRRETGWNVKRVSLKPRNNETALPDIWEADVLRQFEKRQLNGEQVGNITYSEVINEQYRYMKPLVVEPLCLNCHGKKLVPEVKQILKRYYPEDKATGYSPGQIRGAFSLSKKLAQ